MSPVPSITSEFERICGHREGARYCKMDLHTHGPASECSSFTLPGPIEAVFAEHSKAASKKKREDEQYGLIVALAKGENPFAEPYGSEAVSSRPRLKAQPPLEGKAIKRSASAWLRDIRTFYEDDTKAPDKAQREQRTQCVKRAIFDLRRYLASRFFPEEYVQRCLIEGLELTALTDHNHPGYVVPRQGELGTWFMHLEAVNDGYVDAIHRGDPGGKVRSTIVTRLEKALERLGGDLDEVSDVPGAVKKLHKDKSKAFKKLEKRREHIEERLAYWKDDRHVLRPLTILPGVEITASNVHLLAIFPPSWHVSGRISSVLRSIGIPEVHWGRGFVAAASSSVQETISLVDREGGMVVPAHSNSDFKGLLRLFRKGLALTKVLEHPALLALETIGGTLKAGDDGKKGLNMCETLRWLEKGQTRPVRDKQLSFVKGSDAHEVRIELDGTGEDLGARFTYAKMDLRPNDTAAEVFRSLRLALLSGQSRLVEHPAEPGYNYHATGKTSYSVKKSERERLLGCERERPTIVGMTIHGSGAYADGLSVRFNPFLNCVVGSGGKSTLVRLLGYGFGVQGFMRETKVSWLPDLVRVFWRMNETLYCIERRGQHCAPGEAESRWMRLDENNTWTQIEAGAPDPKVEIWPSAEVQDKHRKLPAYEEKVISDLTAHLMAGKDMKRGPLLVNQPMDIFDSHKLFEAVLSKPYLKWRQIVWSTGSSNVPTSLDAEKIIVTREIQGGKKMELACAGDLHEDEIRQAFVDHFEGGELAFARRKTLYTM